MINDNKRLKKYLIDADKIIFSYQCPYLAFGQVIGFIDDFFIKINPSNFSRLSMKKMLRSVNIEDPIIAQFVYENIESGYSLKQIAMML